MAVSGIVGWPEEYWLGASFTYCRFGVRSLSVYGVWGQSIVGSRDWGPVRGQSISSVFFFKKLFFRYTSKVYIKVSLSLYFFNVYF